MLAIACAAFVAGCSSGQTAAAAVNGRVNDWTVPGVLRIESGNGPDNLDPLIGQVSRDTDLSMFWSGHLFNWSDAGLLVPELATVVPTLGNGGISADGRTITYHLRSGVRWQDRQPFDASDVVFTWHAIMNPRNDVAVREGYDLIERIEVPDPHTVVVHLRRSYAPFVTTFFSMSSTAYPILPRHLLERYRSLDDVPYNKVPVGTGPFRVISNDGRLVKMVANPDYWRGAPKLKEVDFRWEPSNATILQRLKQHKIDFYFGAFDQQEPELHGIAGTTIYLYPFNGYEDVGFNMRSPLVSDKRVRQALAYATDRGELLDTVGNGVNAFADSDQAPFSWAHDDGVKRYEYDPATARALLDAAGWKMGPDGIRMKEGRALRLMMVSGGGRIPSTLMERSIRANWRAVGVDVVVRNYDDTTLDAPARAGGITARGKFDAVLEGWVNGVDPDDSSQFMCSMQPPAGWNIYRYCDAALDAAEEDALSQNDQGARERAYARIQARLAEDVPVIVLYFQQQQDVVNLDLKNYRPASAVTPFWNTWQLEI